MRPDNCRLAPRRGTSRDSVLTDLHTVRRRIREWCEEHGVDCLWERGVLHAHADLPASWRRPEPQGPKPARRPLGTPVESGASSRYQTVPGFSNLRISHPSPGLSRTTQEDPLRRAPLRSNTSSRRCLIRAWQDAGTSFRKEGFMSEDDVPGVDLDDLIWTAARKADAGNCPRTARLVLAALQRPICAERPGTRPRPRGSVHALRGAAVLDVVPNVCVT